MEEPQTISGTPPLPPRATSLAARLLNVFAAPGEVFAEVQAAPPTHANWIVPVLISAAVGALAAFLIFSQPAVVQRLHDQWTQGIDQLVKDGRTSPAEAKEFTALAEKFLVPRTLQIFFSLAAVVGSAVRVFWWGFVLWLGARLFLKVRVNYFKAAEMTGLATMISVLGVIATVLLVVNVGNLFSAPGEVLTAGDLAAQKDSGILIGTLNVFAFWFIGVLASGLARLAGVPFGRAMFLVLACWLFQELALILLGLGGMAL